MDSIAVERPGDHLVVGEFRERVSHALAVILRSFLVVVPLLLVLTLFIGRPHQSLALASLLAVIIVIEGQRRAGRILAAVYALVIALVVYGVVDVVNFGSIRTVGTVAFMTAIIVGALFLSRAVLLGLVALCAVLLGGLVYAELAGWLPAPDYSVGWVQWSVYAGVLAAMALNIYYVRNVAIEALSRARRALSERDRVEAALRESEERFAKIFRSSPVSLSVVDLETRELVAANAAAARIFRVANIEEQIGVSLGERFWVDPRELERLLGKLKSEGRVTGAQVQLYRSDGEIFEARLSIETVELSGRRLLINVVEDVSEERAAREALTHSEREATQALERLSFAAEAARVYSWTWQRDTDELTFASPPEELLGPLPADGGYPRFIEMVHPEDRQRHETSSQRILDNLSDYEREFRIIRTDGEVRWLMSRGRAYPDASGVASSMAGIAVDITARKRIEETQVAFEAKLRESQKLESIGTLAGGIAHDFNNILGAILGNLALAKRDIGNRERALISLEEIQKASVRAKHLVQQILTFSRRQPQEFVEQPMRPLLDEAIGLLRVSLPASIEVRARFADEALFVRADATQIGQVLMNLCTNAWHAIHGRNGNIEIELSSIVLDDESAQRLQTVSAGRYARLTVTDDGDGMDEATLKRIFEPFYTTKPVGQGTGLGLAVVHGIVIAHAGAIAVRSRPGVGTTVDLYLPLVAATKAPADATPDTSEPVEGRARHILYVDDDEAMVFLVQRMLEDLGFRVTGFERGDAALEALRISEGRGGGDFDLVVTDYNMPGCSGLDVARETARMRPEIPVVLTSGYVTEELRHEARAAGVRHVIYKPNTINELCEIIRRLLSELVT